MKKEHSCNLKASVKEQHLILHIHIVINNIVIIV